MDIFTAINTRHSEGKVKADELSRDVIEKLLSAGNQAPNHFKVRPWRFVVLTGKGRESFGEQLAAVFHAKFPEASAEALEKERHKALRSPLIIVVAVDQPSEPKVDEVENIAAAAAACQNILLAANALGLGSIWRTGEPARDPAIKKFFGFDPGQHLIGFLYIGYRDLVDVQFPARPSFEDRTTWMD